VKILILRLVESMARCGDNYSSFFVYLVG